jgi:PE family
LRSLCGSVHVREEKPMPFVSTQPRVVLTAADEVSALTAAQFVAPCDMYQAVRAQAAVTNAVLVNSLGSSAGSYRATDAVNAIAAG